MKYIHGFVVGLSFVSIVSGAEVKEKKQGVYVLNQLSTAPAVRIFWYEVGKNQPRETYLNQSLKPYFLIEDFEKLDQSANIMVVPAGQNLGSQMYRSVEVPMADLMSKWREMNPGLNDDVVIKIQTEGTSWMMGGQLKLSVAAEEVKAEGDPKSLLDVFPLLRDKVDLKSRLIGCEPEEMLALKPNAVILASPASKYLSTAASCLARGIGSYFGKSEEFSSSVSELIEDKTATKGEDFFRYALGVPKEFTTKNIEVGYKQTVDTINEQKARAQRAHNRQLIEVYDRALELAEHARTQLKEVLAKRENK